MQASCGYALTSLVVHTEHHRAYATFESSWEGYGTEVVMYGWKSSVDVHPDLLPYSWAETILAEMEDRLSKRVRKVLP